MKFTVVFTYKSGKKDVEFKEFDSWFGCDYWAMKEANYRNAKEYHIA